MKERKSETICFQVSEKTKRLWESIAQDQGRSMSDFIRYAISVYITALEARKRQKNTSVKR